MEEKTDTVGCQGSPKQDALRAQLSELTLLRADSSSKPVAIMLVTSTFIVFGLAAVLAVWNMMKRAREIVDSIKEVERSLLLQESVKYQKPLPFYIMLVTGIAANAIFLLHNLGVV